MVSPVYEHIFAIIIVGVIFVATVVAVPAISYRNFEIVDQQQLRNTAMNVFNAFILGTGSPYNWGSKFPFYSSNVTNFGLAYSKEASQYVLDLDKVQRLDQGTPYYINYSQVRNLLNLQGYGFELTLYRPFKVDWTIQWVGNNVAFGVNVTRSDNGTPIPNAQVNATVIATARKDQAEDLFFMYSNFTYRTDALGRVLPSDASVPIAIPGGYTPDFAQAILEITVSGMTTIVTAQRNNAAQSLLTISTYGDNIVMTYRNGSESLFSEGERNVMQAYGYKLGQDFQFYDSPNKQGDKITNGIGSVDWNNTFPGLTAINPALLLFVIEAPNEPGMGSGRHLTTICGPFNFVDNVRVFRFGDENPRGNEIIKMRRYVLIAGMTYIAELTLWKE